MKKVKKNLFGMGLALSMMLGMVFALMPQETEAKAVEEGLQPGYSNARSAYCDVNYSVKGCKPEFFRHCNLDVFCD